jgi:tetratricopeptide (TPR) repeat protein
VGSHHLGRLAALLLAVYSIGEPFVPRVARAQTTVTPQTRETLNRVAADLFSGAPHPAEAIQQLKAVLAADPNVAEAHMLLGIAYRAQGSPEMMGEAVAELRQAIALQPALMMARLTLARVYLDMSRTSRARDELESALEDVPGHPQLLSLLGEAERQLANPKRSVELNRQALQAEPSFAQARYYLGLALMDLRQYKDAIRELQLVVKSGANAAEAHFGLGAAYLAAGLLNEAIAALREAARLDPSRPETHLHLARAYRLKGQFDAAAAQLTRAADSAKGGLSVLYRDVETELYMEEGLVRVELGQLEAAARSFEKVLAADAGHAAAKQALTEVRRRLRDQTRRNAPGGRR